MLALLNNTEILAGTNVLDKVKNAIVQSNYNHNSTESVTRNINMLNSI